MLAAISLWRFLARAGRRKHWHWKVLLGPPWLCKPIFFAAEASKAVCSALGPPALRAPTARPPPLKGRLLL